MESQRRTDCKSLKSQRLCTIDNGLYMIIDWYEHVPGQPLTCIIQVNDQDIKKSDGIKLPEYLQTVKDITDLEEYMPKALAKADYKPSEE